MGPTCGLILADMGAEVIKIERVPDGDETRRLMGFGKGFFPFLNRNKKSIGLDLKSDGGKAILRKLIVSGRCGGRELRAWNHGAVGLWLRGGLTAEPTNDLLCVEGLYARSVRKPPRT